MGYIGASADAAIGFSDGGLLARMTADIGKRLVQILVIGLQKILIHHLTELNILDPISMLDFNAKAVFPSMGFKWKNSALSYKGLQIADKAPVHDVERNPLTPSPDDSEATAITE